MEKIELYINIPYVVSFILFSYGVTNAYKAIFSNATGKLTHLVVFVAGMLLAVPFGWFEYSDNSDMQLVVVRLIVSYCVGTSLYDLLLKYIIDFFTQKYGKSKPTDNPDNGNGQPNGEGEGNKQ